MLTFSDLRNMNMQRCRKWHSEHADDHHMLQTHQDGMMGWSLSDWFTAFAGEVGETGNVIKKLNRVRDNMVGNGEATAKVLVDKLSEELADAMIYLDLLAASAGIELEDVVKLKFNVVSDRNNFPERL